MIARFFSQLVALSLAQRLLVGLAALLLAGFGMVSLQNLPIDAFPDVSTTQVKIIIKSPGMTPEEVETRITVPIEQEMLGIPKQHILRSTSKYALADITIDFDDGTDIYWARQQVGERLGNVLKDLPPQASGGLAPITTPLGEMFMFTVEGPLSLEEKRTLLDWVIRPQLRTLRGVADVNSLGGNARAFEVVPDVAALNARQLSLTDLETALAENNRNDGAGRVNEGEEALLVRAEGAIRDVDDLRNVVVAVRGGAPVRVGDVAEVRLGALTRYGAVTQRSQPDHAGQANDANAAGPALAQGEAVEGLVLGLRGANARAVVEAVSAKLAEIEPTLPAGTRLVPFYNRGELVARAVHTVTKALLEAVVLVAILLFAFLGSLRAAVVVAAILPLSALATFILMGHYDLSANLMSLGGLAIAIGMLVDGAVVVVENIESHLHARAAGNPTALSAHDKLALVFRAVVEVAPPVASGVAIIAIVFLPLLTLEGLEGKLFMPVALAIVFALGASLLLAFTVVPAAASLLLKPAHGDPWLVRKLTALYDRLLPRALANPRPVLIGAGLSLVLAVGAYLGTGKTFMPTLDEGDLIVQLEKLPSIGLSASTALDQQVQAAILQDIPEVRRIVARTGADELGLDPMGLNQTDTFLVLKPVDEWRTPDKAWLADQLRQVLDRFPGVVYSFTQPIEMRVSEMLTGVRGDVAIKIYGPDIDTLNGLAAQVQGAVKGVPGAEDVITLKNEGVQYLSVGIDRLAAGRLGFSVNALEADLKRLIEGTPVGVVVEPGRRTPLLLRGPGADSTAPALADLRLQLPDGRAVPLSAVATLKRVEGPVKVDRENAQRYVVVQSNVRDRDLVGFVDDARAAVAAKVKLPAGYRIAWGGQFENQQRAAARLALVVPMALLLIFGLLFVTFGSLRQAALVLANIPFALVGGAISLFVSGEYLSVPASVGFIALLGIAVLNGVVLVSYFNTLRDQGLPLDEVVREGARRRLRPVLMTASITAFGLVPLLFASGPGSEIQRPLAIVVVGGLISSTLLTLVLLPILYRRFGVPRNAESDGSNSGNDSSVVQPS
ncbi:efflux RND transporter permease subunit [Oryzomicrobium sp.]|uniref:efflux RND transporter permease subunit n=1 Tax=Oryzomicrobium sp. TaxID=1911578 RepID=UPI002FE147E4